MSRFSAILAGVLAAALLVLAFAPDVSANPPREWELETVESLQINNDGDRLVFTFNAPPPSCVNADGIKIYRGCPNVTWTCPDGITTGALGRLARDVPYDKAVAGYASRESMCLLSVPNPQPVAVPVAVPVTPAVVVDPPALAFTGAESDAMTMVGLGLVGIGFVAIGSRRRWLD